MRAAAIAVLWLIGVATAAAAAGIPAVAYHDIVAARNGDPYAITVDEFAQQLAYLKRAGYEPISLKQLDAARRGDRALPSKPILLTFDDALRSFDVHARPLLERYGYPAVVSIVSRWADAGCVGADAHAGMAMTWDELRALSRSPLVELISHSDDLHRGIAGDAHATQAAAATARVFDATRGMESDAARATRVSNDVARSAARIKDELGISPVAIAWPYGEYDATLVAAAAAAGMTYHLTLDDVPTTLATLPQINRFTLHRYQGLADFSRALAFQGHYRRDQRFVEVGFDMFAGATADERARMLGQLLDRLRLLRVNSVILHPFTADGARAFFSTGALPVDDDLALRVTMAILRRTSVQRIYLRLPPVDVAAGAALVSDFARRHVLHGVLLDGDAAAADIDRIRKIVRSYRPYAHVYVPSRLTHRTGDAIWAEVDTSASSATLRAVARRFDAASTLYLVRHHASDDALRAALTALREGGARHYGYAADAMLANRPDARVIVAPLHAHTIAVRAP